MAQLSSKVRADIETCKEALEKGNSKEIYKMLYMTYGNMNPKLPSDMGWSENEDFDIKIKQLMSYLETLKSLREPKLISLFTRDISKKSSIETNVKVHNSNVNNVSFREVKDSITDNEFIANKEKTDILAHLDSIERISNSEDSKTKKWDKIKPILLKVMDKGVGITIQILPLIVKALSE